MRVRKVIIDGLSINGDGGAPGSLCWCESRCEDSLWENQSLALLSPTGLDKNEVAKQCEYQE